MRELQIPQSTEFIQCKRPLKSRVDSTVCEQIQKDFKISNKMKNKFLKISEAIGTLTTNWAIVPAPDDR
jgi:hypothetical protein